jgi:hypothetical protein
LHIHRPARALTSVLRSRFGVVRLTGALSLALALTLGVLTSAATADCGVVSPGKPVITGRTLTASGASVSIAASADFTVQKISATLLVGGPTIYEHALSFGGPGSATAQFTAPGLSPGLYSATVSWLGGDLNPDGSHIGNCQASAFSPSVTFTVPRGCPSLSTRTGPGYNDLNGQMKSALSRLFTNLDAIGACYKWIIGFRNESYQQDLYDRWHAIADHNQGNPKVCSSEKAAHFAQCPTGYQPNGMARGGPAKPGKSRHEHHEAADITVRFPPSFEENTVRYRAAGAAAGLCGPPASDPVHGELPYVRAPETVARCHFG